MKVIELDQTSTPLRQLLCQICTPMETQSCDMFAMPKHTHTPAYGIYPCIIKMHTVNYLRFPKWFCLC